MKTWIKSFLLLIFLAAACNNSDYTPTPLLPSEPFSQTDLRVGTGTEIALGQRATVNYTGWIYDPARPEKKGTQFDSTTGRGPLTITIANGSVIGGWVRGVPGMRVGGMRRLIIPPDLAYGSAGNGPIPPNATLVFDIELLEVQ